MFLLLCKDILRNIVIVTCTRIIIEHTKIVNLVKSTLRLSKDEPEGKMNSDERIEQLIKEREELERRIASLEEIVQKFTTFLQNFGELQEKEIENDSSISEDDDHKVIDHDEDKQD